MERRAWLNTSADKIYPNMFIALVGPPGTGKDQAIIPGRNLMLRTGRLNVAPQSMTHKGMIDVLAEFTSRKQFQDPVLNKTIDYHSMIIIAPEMGVIMPSHDLGFLSLLNDLFNCDDKFEERIRGRGETLTIERPHLHILTGTQPQYLEELLPDAAFGMGFTARIVMVYHGVPTKVSPFAIRRYDKTLEDALVSDLAQVCRFTGPFQMDAEAEEAIVEWHLKISDTDRPTHSKLVHYSARRIMQILKLSMCFSAARDNKKIVLMEDFQEALSLLLLTEAGMPEIFKEMQSSYTQRDDIEETFNFVMRWYLKHDKRPVPEHVLIHFLQTRVPVNQIDYILETMLRAKIIKEAVQSNQLNIPSQFQARFFTPQQIGDTN